MSTLEAFTKVCLQNPCTSIPDSFDYYLQQNVCLPKAASAQTCHGIATYGVLEFL